MWRNIGAAVLGYVAMFAIVFVLLSLTWVAMGPDGAFRPGVWEVSGGWIVSTIVIGLLAAMGGGWLAARVGTGGQAVLLLIVIILVMSVLSAFPEGEAVAGPRPGTVSMTDAMTQARPPTWLMWLNPVLGIVGVLLGARWGRRAPPATSAGV